MDYKKSQNNYFATPKDNPKDKIELVIGDDKQVAFYPQKKVKRWDNEVNVSIRLVHNEKAPTFRKDPDKVVWTGEKVEAHFYDIDPSDEHPEGASEFEIFLKEKPVTNVVSFTVVDKGVEYYYQPELADEEVQEMVDKEGISLLEAKRQCRPENVVGSYAIYAKEPKQNIVGGKQYKCGKVGHIYRPRIEDANGVKVWGELKIDKGLLTVTIPQEFIDNAVYPVRHAAGLTFGYTSLGSRALSIGVDNIITSIIGTASTDGILLKIQAALWSPSGVGSVGMALYNDTGGSPTTLVSNSYSGSLSPTRTTSPTQDSEWFSKDGVSGIVVNGNKYWIVLNSNNSTLRISADSGLPSGTSRYKVSPYGNFPVNLITSTSANTNMFSIYATYTASGGSSAIKTINGLAKASVKTWNGLAIASVKSINGLT